MIFASVWCFALGYKRKSLEFLGKTPISPLKTPSEPVLEFFHQLPAGIFSPFFFSLTRNNYAHEGKSNRAGESFCGTREKSATVKFVNYFAPYSRHCCFMTHPPPTTIAGAERASSVGCRDASSPPFNIRMTRTRRLRAT